MIAEERQERALALRKAGVSSLRKIADQLNLEGYVCNHSTVREDIRKARAAALRTAVAGRLVEAKARPLSSASNPRLGGELPLQSPHTVCPARVILGWVGQISQVDRSKKARHEGLRWLRSGAWPSIGHCALSAIHLVGWYAPALRLVVWFE
jgi:hypothetical protein